MAPANEFPGNIFFYLIILGFGAFFALTVIMRLIPFFQAKRVSRLDHLPARVRDFFLVMMAQSKFFRRKYWYSGILHVFIFWGFMVLLIRSLNLLLDGVSADISLQHLAWRRLHRLAAGDGPVQCAGHGRRGHGGFPARVHQAGAYHHEPGRLDDPQPDLPPDGDRRSRQQPRDIPWNAAARTISPSLPLAWPTSGTA